MWRSLIFNLYLAKGYKDVALFDLILGDDMLYAVLLRPGYVQKKNGKFDIKHIATSYDITPISNTMPHDVTFKSARHADSIAGFAIFNEEGVKLVHGAKLALVTKGDDVTIRDFYKIF